MTRLMLKAAIFAASIVIALMIFMVWRGGDGLLLTVAYRNTSAPALVDHFALVDVERGLALARTSPISEFRSLVLAPDGHHVLLLRRDNNDPQQVAFTMYDIIADRSVHFGESPSFIVGWLQGWSPDGRYYLYREDNELMRYDVRDGTITELFDQLDSRSTARWSPDSTRIAVTTAVAGMFIIEGTTVHAIEPIGYSPLVAWSPDSTLLAYPADVDTVRVYDVTQATTRDYVLSNTAPPRHLVWSPDQRWLSVVVDETHGRRMFNIDTHTGEVHRIDTEPHSVSMVLWSPDSRRVGIATAHNRDASDDNPFYIIHPTGADRVQVNADVIGLQWHDDAIYYQTDSTALYRYSAGENQLIFSASDDFYVQDTYLLSLTRTTSDSRLYLAQLNGTHRRAITPPEHYITDFRVR